MVDATPPELPEARSLWQLVRNAGSQHQLARQHVVTIFESHHEGPVRAGDLRGPRRPYLHAPVRLELLAPDLQ
jgi:hypothetical protein